MAATAMMVTDPPAATGLYPRLYPTLEDPSGRFLPIRPQEEAEEEDNKRLLEKEEAEEEKNEEEEEEEEETGLPVMNGGGEVEVEEPQRKASDEKKEDKVSPKSATQEPTSPGQIRNAASAESREATADAAIGQQTTNGNVMNEATDGRENHTAKGEAVVNGSQLTQREEYVDRVWEEFVTHFLLGSRHIQKAAIFDLDTRRPLAMNGNLRISEEELEQLVASLHHHQLAYRNGVTVEGRTYKVRLADGRNGIWARSGMEGCTACKTHTLVIIGVHDESGNARKCNEDVMRLGDFFRKKAL